LSKRVVDIYRTQFRKTLAYSALNGFIGDVSDRYQVLSEWINDFEDLKDSLWLYSDLIINHPTYRLSPGPLKTIVWTRHGQQTISRERGPMVIEILPTTVRYKWFRYNPKIRDNILHREDGPALIEFTPTQKILYWFENGSLTATNDGHRQTWVEHGKSKWDVKTDISLQDNILIRRSFYSKDIPNSYVHQIDFERGILTMKGIAEPDTVIDTIERTVNGRSRANIEEVIDRAKSIIDRYKEMYKLPSFDEELERLYIL
jgi:hypothetical protein